MAERAERWTEADLINLLRARFPKESHALLPHVRNGTGWQRETRTADAIVMGLWPSRGLELEGFECKVSRADWRRELKAPAKAETIFGYCHRWWIVAASEKVVDLTAGELPPTWGLLVARGGKLEVAVAAPRLEPKPMTLAFIAALFRTAQGALLPETQLAAEFDRGRKEGFDAGSKHGKWEAQAELRELERLKKCVAEFEKASGVRIDAGWGAGRIGDAVRQVLTGRHASEIRKLEQLLGNLRQIEASIERAIRPGEADHVV